MDVVRVRRSRLVHSSLSSILLGVRAHGLAASLVGRHGVWRLQLGNRTKLFEKMKVRKMVK